MSGRSWCGDELDSRFVSLCVCVCAGWNAHTFAGWFICEMTMAFVVAKEPCAVAWGEVKYHGIHFVNDWRKTTGNSGILW